jgi:hypothetical protein
VQEQAPVEGAGQPKAIEPEKKAVEGAEKVEK